MIDPASPATGQQAQGAALRAPLAGSPVGGDSTDGKSTTPPTHFDFDTPLDAGLVDSFLGYCEAQRLAYKDHEISLDQRRAIALRRAQIILEMVGASA
jgi:hypothetical protein